MLASFGQVALIAAPAGLAAAGTAVAGLLAVRLAALRDQLTAARRAATHDPLTGLLNRAGLAAAWSQLADRSAVLLLDLDGFKPVNDQHGHGVGDQVLTEVATRLRYQVPGAVARLGGDEFAAITTSDDPCQVARRLAAAIARPVTLPDGTTVTVTASVGVALDHGGDLVAALGCADAAMYRAKNTGHTVAVYHPRRDDRPASEPRPAVRVRDLAVDRRSAWQVAA